MAGVGTAYVDVRANLKGFDDDVRRAGEGLSGAFSEYGKKIGKALVTGIAGYKVAQFTKDSVKQASDLTEQTNKVAVVFGAASGKVLDFSKNSATAFGQSREQALAAAGTFGNLFRTIGLTTDQSANMSDNLVKLAADLASFNNSDPTEVLDALQSGLVGEVRPMRQFGVSLDEMSLKQEAFNLGLITSTKGVLPPAIKAQAAYSLMMKETTLAQGDFQRTSGQLANQQRILSAQWIDFKAQLGMALLPTVLNLVKALNTYLIPALARDLPIALDFIHTKIVPLVKTELPQLIQRFKDFGAWIAEHHTAMHALGESFAFITHNLDTLVPSILAVMVAMKAMRIAATGVTLLTSAFNAFGGLSVIMGSLATALEGVTLVAFGVVAAIAAIAAAVVIAYFKVKPFHDAVNSIAHDLVTGFRTALSWVTEVGWPAMVAGAQGVADGFDRYLMPAVRAVREAFTAVRAVVAPLAAFMADGLSAAITEASHALAPLGPMLDNVGGWLTGLADIIRRYVGAAFYWLGERINHLEDTFASVGRFASRVGAAFAGIGRAIMTALQPTIDWLSAHLIPTIGAAIELAAAILERLREALEQVAKIARWAFEQMVTTIKDAYAVVKPLVMAMAAMIRAYLVSAFEAIRYIVATAMDFIGPIIRFTFDNVVTVIKAAMDILRPIIGTALDYITGVWSIAWGTISQTVRTAFDIAQRLLGAALDTLRGLMQIATGLITLNWSKTWEGIKTTFGGIWDYIVAVVTGAVDLVRITIGTFVDTVKLIFTTGWGLVRDLFTGTWNALYRIVTEGGSHMLDYITGIPSRILTALGGLKDLLFDIGHNLLRGMLHGLQDEWSAVWAFFSGIPARIKDGLVGAGKWLYDTGHALLEGLWNGLKDMWNWMADKFEIHSKSVHIIGTPWDLPELDFSLMPHLASGAVLTSPMAFLGGEYSGARTNPEIVSPIDTMRAAFRSELSDFPTNYGNDGAASPVIHVYIGNEELTGHVDTRIELANEAVAIAARAGRR